MIILHPRWQYVYWFLAFCLCGILITVCHAVFQGTKATTVAVFHSLIFVSTIATYIDKNEKICWGSKIDWNIKRLPTGQWQCLRCGETSVYLSNLANMSHRFLYICKDDEKCTGCDQKVYQCDEDRVKHSQIKRSASYPKGELYRVCVKERENCSNPDL